MLARYHALKAVLLTLVALGIGTHGAQAHGDEMRAVLEGAPLGP